MQHSPVTPTGGPPPGRVLLHPAAVRIAHWTFALAVLVLIASGWRIHDFSGFVAWLHIPEGITLGGRVPYSQDVHGEVGLAGALLWHFAAMWLLFGGLGLFLVWAVATGHFRRRYLPIRPAAVLRDVGDFFHGRLGHQLGARNAVQRLLYAGAVAAMAVMVWSGLAIWKPTTLYALAWPLGGYIGARYVHFLGMTALVGFTAVHVLLVVLVPKVLPPMITGRAPADEVAPEALRGAA